MKHKLAVVAVLIGVLLTQIVAARQGDIKCKCVWPWPEVCNSICRSGTWAVAIASGARGGSTSEMTLNIKIDGDKLTGFVSTGKVDLPMSDVKVKDDEISFTVKTMSSRGGGERTVFYKGKIEGDEIRFTRQVEGSDQQEKFTAKRAKL